jgi:thiol-disulfide isomerase/thioredoxin
MPPRRALFAVLFAALACVAAPLYAADTAHLETLREGDMKKLTFHAAPKAVSDVSFGDLDGGSHSLADFEGKIVLLNFWATWCAPCREEMPSLDALNAALGGNDFEVVTVATGRNPPQGIRRFFEQENIATLPMFTDARQELAREMAVLGLPITVILDRQGREIARLRGDADWNSESARAIVLSLIDPES